MRKSVTSWGTTILLAILAARPAGAACDEVTLGAGVSLAEETAVAAILAAPEDFVGRAVAVRGEVTEVCDKAGCWLELRAEGGDGRIRVKVDDGVIVFPMWARGHAARAQGSVEKLELSRDDFILFREHEAHEGGPAFDAATVAGDGPFAVYRIRGTGAAICK
jgi:hypothetical protein